MATNLIASPLTSHPDRRVRLYGQPNSAAACKIRDFLSRSVVEFDWIELTCNEDCHLFICIGGVPNTEWAKDTDIIRDNAGYLITGPDLLNKGHLPSCWPLERDPFFLETSVPGSFAAGDVRHGSVKRVASAVGEGAMAVTFVHKYLEETR